MLLPKLFALSSGLQPIRSSSAPYLSPSLFTGPPIASCPLRDLRWAHFCFILFHLNTRPSPGGHLLFCDVQVWPWPMEPPIVVGNHPEKILVHLLRDLCHCCILLRYSHPLKTISFYSQSRIVYTCWDCMNHITNYGIDGETSGGFIALSTWNFSSKDTNFIHTECFISTYISHLVCSFYMHVQKFKRIDPNHKPKRKNTSYLLRRAR